MRALVSWIGGKDVYGALMRVRRGGDVAIEGLLTTLVREPDRVGVHEVPAELIRRQAQALQLPLVEVFAPAAASNAQYEAALAEALAPNRVSGVDALVFGDLFLADIRAYRDALAGHLGVRTIYPLWGADTGALAREVVASGTQTTVCSVDLARLPLAFAGRAFDAAFLDDLPEGIDPCGENGEFHTFVHAGPGFHHPVGIRRGSPEARGALGCCSLL